MTPAPRQLQAFGLLIALGTAMLLLPQLLVPWLVSVAVLAGLSLGDALLLWRRRPVRVERHINPSLALGVTRRVGVRFFNEDSRALNVEMFDHHPASVTADQLPLALRVEPGHWLEEGYDITPLERGRHDFGPIDLRVHSPLRFWTRRFLIDADQTVSVFPNFAAVTKYAILGVDANTAAGGLQLRPRRGEGSEFHQLREYRVGDTFRQIDWKASARLSKLIAKEYQEERDQQVVFMVDTGRRMLAREDGLSHFDHVLNSMLLLSYVALRQGDAVGFMTCGTSTRWMKPRKGLSTMSTLTRRLFDLQPEELAVDYQAAATQLAMYQKRRALIVLLTNIRDEDSDDLKVAFNLLRKRHVLLVASLREPGVDTLLERNVSDFGGARDFASAHHYLAARRATLDRLSSRGVVIEDTSCAQLPQAISNRYLDIKRAGVL